MLISIEDKIEKVCEVRLRVKCTIIGMVTQILYCQHGETLFGKYVITAKHWQQL